jgi:hypothetical protein
MPTTSSLPPLKPRGFHLMLSGKGGVGKSVVSRLLAEFLADEGDPPLAFDADPINASFAAVPAFKANPVDLLDEDQKVDASQFDAMIDEVLQAERSVVIDSGASSYLPLLNYIEESDLIPELKAEGFEVYFHSVITGGAAVDFTTQNFDTVASAFGDEASIVVWLNHFWEKVSRDGKPFTEWRTYHNNRARVHTVLEIPKMTSDTSAADFAQMLKENLSFAEASDPQSHFRVMQRSRLRKIKRVMFEGMQLLHPVHEQAEAAQEVSA